MTSIALSHNRDLERVRHQLDSLVAERLYRGLSPGDECRFQDLCGQELSLLEFQPTV
jgi:hypothetical protein